MVILLQLKSYAVFGNLIYTDGHSSSIKKTLLHFVIPVARGQQVLYEKFIRNFIKYISPECICDKSSG
jgi:hypothetical protein